MEELSIAMGALVAAIGGILILIGIPIRCEKGDRLVLGGFVMVVVGIVVVILTVIMT